MIISYWIFVGVLLALAAFGTGMFVVDIWYVLRHGHRSMFSGPDYRAPKVAAK